MSEIPFVNELGDALGKAIGSEGTSGGRRRNWFARAWRSAGPIVLVAASSLVVAGVVAVALTLHPASRHSGTPPTKQGLKTAPVGKSRHGLGPPAINLPPGVVTMMRQRPAHVTPFAVTLQRILFQGRQYVCLAVTQGPGTSSQCRGPLPLPDKPLVAVETFPTICRPRPAELIWGLALKDVAVELRYPGRSVIAERKPIPAGLHARGTFFYVWARSAPDSLVARSKTGKLEQTYLLSGGHALPFDAICKLHPALVSPPSAAQLLQRVASAPPAHK